MNNQPIKEFAFAKFTKVPALVKAHTLPSNVHAFWDKKAKQVIPASHENHPPLRLILNHRDHEINQHIPLLLSSKFKKSIYQIHLTQMIGKYIGETEKNIDQIFQQAEEKNWILFFDEADSLFGKRTEVKDAHDKYANQEISYLLQKIENSKGIILINCLNVNCTQNLAKYKFQALSEVH
mgnify:CR=1 FL=1